MYQNRTLKITLPLLVILFRSVASFSQVDQSSELFKTLKLKDSLVFNEGFNKCELSQFDRLVSNDFEFYHDQAGATLTKADFINSIKKNICSLPYKPRRELIDGSLEVYPLYNNGVLYGAIQNGRHRFYSDQEGKPEKLTSIAKFSTLWVKNGENWQIKRIFSYDHIDDPWPGTGETQIFDNDTAINDWILANRVPILGIGVIDNGKLQDVKVFGEIKKGEPAPYNTIFSIASLTKPITSMLTLKLVDMRLWSLDEPLDQYWIDPDVKDDPRHSKLTTRIILSHQTGFPNWRYENADGKLHFEFEPGTNYQYSGEGFEYLRHAIENKFHTTLDKLADSILFKPLRMTDTHYTWDESIDTMRLARGIDASGNIMTPIKNTKANAADLLRTTVSDYGSFLAAAMNGKLFSKNIYDEMISHQVRTKKINTWD